MATKTSVKKVEEAKIIEKTTVFEIAPRATEKSYAEQAKRTYVFAVPLFASKQSVKKAVEEEFKVSVTSVRVLTRKGKKTRYSKGKHQYPGTTFRRDHKFAYVTVKEGDKIPVFDDANEAADKGRSTSSAASAAASGARSATEEETKERRKLKKAKKAEEKAAEKATKKGDK